MDGSKQSPSPSYKRAGALLIVMTISIVIAILIMVIGTRKDNAREREDARMNERVSAHADTAYGNKWLMDEELVDRDEGYITDRLTSLMEKYMSRTVTIRIDGKDRRQYSMEELGEKVGFVINEAGKKTVYPQGRESALARHIVSIDKDLPVEEQDDIIRGIRQTTKAEITVRCTSDKNILTELASKYSKKYDKAPKNATINANMKITSEKNGRVLDTTAMVRDLTEYLDSTEEADFLRNYQTKKVKATVKASYLKKINTSIGSYSTVLITNNVRGKNVRLAASRIDGRVLKPEEQISFLDALYDDSDGKKYGKAGGFLNNKVVQVEGGGICQVSTTAYDAFLIAGIIPVERFPHTCRVSYAVAGLDAALAVGTKDLVVKNTLKYPIMIRSNIEGNRLYVRIYSYKEAKGGYTYKPRAVSEKGSLTYVSYLDKYLDGVRVESVELSRDTYKKLKG